MKRLRMICWYLAAMALPAPAFPQQKARPDPADPGISVPPVIYVSPCNITSRSVTNKSRRGKRPTNSSKKSAAGKSTPRKRRNRPPAGPTRRAGPQPPPPDADLHAQGAIPATR